MSSQRHRQKTTTLACDHIVTCNCQHKAGDMVWCMVCKDYRLATNVLEWLEPATDTILSNAPKGPEK